MKKEIGIFALLVVLCVVTTFVDPNRAFIKPDNLQNLAQQIGMFGVFSIGLGLVIITGGIDLSVGSVFALQGVLLAMMLTEWHWPWPMAVMAIIALGIVLGAFHGFLITRVGLQPFIVTLCGLLFYRGLAQFVTKDESKGLGESKGFEGVRDVINGNFLGVPASFWLLLITAGIMAVVLHRSIYGRYLYASGRNEAAARYSGINTHRVIASSYIILGALGGLAAIVIAFYTNAIQASTHAQSYELYGIAAAVLGGCSLRGGEGSIFGIVIGTALLQVLQNLVNLLGIPSSLNFAVMGAVILIGVLADQLVKNRGKRLKTAPIKAAPAPVVAA